jgi:hypothetical protein
VSGCLQEGKQYCFQLWIFLSHFLRLNSTSSPRPAVLM